MEARRPCWRRIGVALVLSLIVVGLRAGAPVALAQDGSGSGRPRNVEPVGHLGGSVHIVEVRGGYAYLGQAGRLVILDVSNPAQPEVVGKSAPLGYDVRQIVLRGEYAYLAVVGDTVPPEPHNGGIRIVRITDPTNPVDVGFYPVTQRKFPDLVLMGSYGFVTTGTIPHGWDLIDFSDPANPQEVAQSVLPDGLAVHSGGYVYVYSSRPYQLRAFDVSDPAQPRLVSTLDHGWHFESLSLLGSTLYLRSDDKQVQTIDVSDPASPRIAMESCCGRTLSAHVTVSGDRAYLLAVQNRLLKLFDISDAANPVELGTSNRWTGPPQGAAVNGNTVYVTAADAGLRIHVVDGAKQMPEVGALDGPGQPTGSTSVALAGPYVCVADSTNGLHVVRVDDPARPIHVGAYRGGTDAMRVAASGGYVYVLERRSPREEPGLRVLDVRDPTRPVSVGRLSSSGGADDLAVSGSYVYFVASGELHVVDVSDPTQPAEVGVYAPQLDPSLQGSATSGRYGRIAIAGQYAYLASSTLVPVRGTTTPAPAAASSGLRVVDISNPATPTEVGFARLAWDPDAVAVVGNHVYVIAHQVGSQLASGLKVFDVSNPADPVEVASLPTGRTWFNGSISVAGQRAYVAGDGLHVLDVADPARPVEVGFYPGRMQSGAASGNLVYLGMGSDGLEVVRFTGGGP